MGLVLFLLSFALGIVFLPIGIIYALLKCFINKHFDLGVKSADDKFHKLAKAFDQYGNYVCAELFNATLIKKSGQPFGNIVETISSVIAKNKKAGTLTTTGKVLCFILTKLNDPSFK
jgi:hypothetical protein